MHPKKKKQNPTNLGSIWYMGLKIKNFCLKIFVEIRVNEKVCGNT